MRKRCGPHVNCSGVVMFKPDASRETVTCTGTATIIPLRSGQYSEWEDTCFTDGCCLWECTDRKLVTDRNIPIDKLILIAELIK